MLTRDQIIAARNKAPEPCYTPELGEGYCRRFTTAQWLEWREFSQSATDEKTGQPAYPDIYHAKLVQLSYCNAAGELVFGINDVPQIIASLDYRTIAQIFIVSCQVNALTKQDVWLEVARARENFTKTTANSTSTGSPPTSANLTQSGSAP